MRQITTITTLPNAERNALVVAANIPCQANGCERKATRWSNLCGLCEMQWLEDHKPVFGKPSKDPCADIAESGLGQRMSKEGIEHECLAVSTSLPWHDLVSVTHDHIGHSDTPQPLVSRWEALTVRIKVLLSRPRERIRFQLEGT